MDQRMSSSDFYQRGLVLKKARMFDPAVEDFQQAARDPRYAPQAYVQMALCLKAVGRYDDAVQAFRQAVVSPALSSDEQLQIFYQMGRTLESAGRYSESIEVYGLIRKENPRFGDVARRIKYLCSGGRESVPSTQALWGDWIKAAFAGSRLLKPHMRAFFQQVGQWLGRGTANSPLSRTGRLDRSSGQDRSGLRSRTGHAGNERTRSAQRKRLVEHRRCVRVPIRLQSYFAAKGRMVAGKGELRDLSPWGCRVASAVAVPIGADLQCCIFPRQSGDAFMIEGATVRWTGPKEFGLAFTDISPAVQQQLMQLCRAAA